MKVIISNNGPAPKKQPPSAILTVAAILNAAADTASGFFKVDGDQIVFDSFANTQYFRALAVVLLICEDEIYFRSAYTPRQGIALQSNYSWDNVLDKLNRFDLKKIEIQLEA